jgi:hypothetical protein
VEMGRGPWGWMVSSEELEERKQRRVEIQATEGNNDQRPVASRDEEAMVMQTGNQCCGEMPDVLAHTKRDGGVRTCGGGGGGDFDADGSPLPVSGEAEAMGCYVGFRRGRG